MRYSSKLTNELPDMNDLRALWHEITSRYTSDNLLVDELWTEIEKQYTGKKRHYHNLTHLAYMSLKAIAYKNHLNDFNTVLFAIFYHDIIYHPKHQDNEQRSADIASERLNRLGVPGDKISKCHIQILATKDHRGHHDSDTNYLLNFDLAVLGESWQTYQDYALKIRQEYSLYPDFIYKRGRKKVLQHFLKMDSIYKTQEFQDRYEQPARENLRAELQSL